MSGRRCVLCLAVLLGACCFLALAGKSNGAEPEKLISVSLESGKKAFTVMPLYCLGVDIVNPNQRCKDVGGGKKQMSFDCLPGAMVWLEDPKDASTESESKSKSEAFLTILPQDAGKTLHLRFDGCVCYKNDVPCSIAFPRNRTAEQTQTRLDLLRGAKKNNQLEGLTVSVYGDDASLPVLNELKGTGVGLMLDAPSDKKIMAISKQVARAAVEVKPKRLTTDNGTLALLDGDLSTVESLLLVCEASKEVVPDLSRLTSLRHLLLAAGAEVKTIDATHLSKLVNLTTLTVFADECKNVEAIGSLKDLQFLVVCSKSPGDLSFVKRLSKLRYLAAAFPIGTDFSFVEKMPDLQTLCILDVKEKHNLRPLEKASRLRCLALSGEDIASADEKFVQKDYKNVKELQKARPDVEVVEYQGICLGSFWMLVLAAMAAVAAWVVRRCRRGNRLACQR
jgi:hypothetical protein